MTDSDAYIESCTVIVTSGNELMLNIHDRMPVILTENAWDAWLNTTNTDKQALQNLLRQYPYEEMTAWRVATIVNNPRQNDIVCIQSKDSQG